MYAALWRRLPGGRLAKSAQCALLAALVVAALFAWVFPVVQGWLPLDEVTVPTPTPTPTATLTR